MKKHVIIAIAAAACGFAACKKKPPENVPVPKAAADVQASAVSTGTVIEQNPLKMPGNYLRTEVGHISEAKAAKALAEKTAKEHMGGLDLGGGSGN